LVRKDGDRPYLILSTGIEEGEVSREQSISLQCAVVEKTVVLQESIAMTLELYAHPFSSYCQKVLIALYENSTPFRLKILDQKSPENAAELARLWPLKKFPVLVDDGNAVIESSVIIEHLAIKHPGPIALIPSVSDLVLDVRFMDRFFDNYVMTPMQKSVFEALRPGGARRDEVMADARQALEGAYAWLENRLVGRTWATGETFTMADCAAAPSLFFADWVHQIGPDFRLLRAYRSRLLARPSFARAVEEARPYRNYFPLGAPDRD
jgi:glutathione S-transferase